MTADGVCAQQGTRALDTVECSHRGRADPPFPSFGGRRPWNPQPSSRTRTRRSGSRPKRRSRGAGEAFAVRRKRNRAYFATTQGQRGTTPAAAQQQKRRPPGRRSPSNCNQINSISCSYSFSQPLTSCGALRWGSDNTPSF